MAEHVTIFEVGPRDGLQNEAAEIATTDKVQLVDMLSATGLSRIEVTSFVSPKWVPQMADAAQVMAGIKRVPGVTYTVLTPNLRGLDRAIDAGADEVAVFGSASEGFSKANINCSIDESFERFLPVIDAAANKGVPVRGYVSCVTDCPYDGPTPPEKVAEVASRLADAGCREISLGDTIGKGTPETVSRMLKAVISAVPSGKIAGHFHDTNGRATDNIEVSLELGVRVFDASVGGLGGCPYAPGAKGNVATEAATEWIEALGFETGIDRDALGRTAKFARNLRGLE